jgi:hypothetical protein
MESSHASQPLRSNFGEFLPSQVHRELNISHNLQSLHPVHAISHTKINTNSRKNHRTLYQHLYLFEKFYFNPCFWIKFGSRDILKSCSIARGYQLVSIRWLLCVPPGIPKSVSLTTKSSIFVVGTCGLRDLVSSSAGPIWMLVRAKIWCRRHISCANCYQIII